MGFRIMSIFNVGLMIHVVLSIVNHSGSPFKAHFQTYSEHQQDLVLHHEDEMRRRSEIDKLKSDRTTYTSEFPESLQSNDGDFLRFAWGGQSHCGGVQPARTES